MKNVGAIQERQVCHCVGGYRICTEPTISICSDVPNYLSSYFLPIISDSLVAVFVSLSSRRICCLPPPSVFAAAYCICNSEFAYCKPITINISSTSSGEGGAYREYFLKQRQRKAVLLSWPNIYSDSGGQNKHISYRQPCSGGRSIESKTQICQDLGVGFVAN